MFRPFLWGCGDVYDQQMLTWLLVWMWLCICRYSSRLLRRMAVFLGRVTEPASSRRCYSDCRFVRRLTLFTRNSSALACSVILQRTSSSNVTVWVVKAAIYVYLKDLLELVLTFRQYLVWFCTRSIAVRVARLTDRSGSVCHSVKCPIPTCPTPKFRVKRLRPLPARWAEIAPETRQAIALELRKFRYTD